MERCLEPHKSVLRKGDLSDFEEKVDCDIADRDVAEEIIENTQKWVKLLCDPLKERPITTLVLDKHFRLSRQT